MIKTVINPDGDKEKMPSWALRYLEKNNLFYYFIMIKKSYRHKGFLELISKTNGIDYSNVFYFNKKGDVVFFWPTAKHRTEFLLMLS